MNSLSNLTVVVLTYKTDLQILKNCIQSIETNVKIKIIENSSNFKDQDYFLNKFPNITVHCTNQNLGFGAGNNYGLNLLNTEYALVLSPDTVCDENFFEKVKYYLNKNLDYTIIGSSYKDDKIHATYGFFPENLKKKLHYKSPNSSLLKVDWVAGCCMLLNLEKFNKQKIFDEKFFLYFEEFNLCKKISLKNENVFSSKDLLISHLGFKSSFSPNPILRDEANKLREWHWMWSMFYFYRNNYGYLFALKKTIGKLIKYLIKTVYFSLTFNKALKNKFKCRFLGLLNSMLGKKSSYRID
tara:strand:+ start:674 stop:1567 length:894 start_codon:yes stop_codon:yes gene_type:complete